MREFYVFGSICRGEVDSGSDIDVLVITDSSITEIPPAWSIYSLNRIRSLFKRGTLFAWHIYLESIPIKVKDSGFIRRIGPPTPYQNAPKELAGLQIILNSALSELENSTPSRIYELGLIALACRDAAMAAFPTIENRFNFSRFSPLELSSPRFPLSRKELSYLLACRRATTRGNMVPVDALMEKSILKKASGLARWIEQLINKVTHEKFH